MISAYDEVSTEKSVMSLVVVVNIIQVKIIPVTSAYRGFSFRIVLTVLAGAIGER